MCVVVTGAAKGIGEAVARKLAQDGLPLLLVDVDEAALASIARDLSGSGHDVRTVVGSVADPVVAEAVSEQAAAMGGATGLSHNAGIQRYGTAADTAIDLGTK